MKRKYSELSCANLRDLAINGKIERKSMTRSLYESLLDNEAGFDEPSAVVLELCVAGLKQFDDYKDYEDSVIWGNSVAKRLKLERESDFQSEPESKSFTVKKPRTKRLVLIAAAIVLFVGLSGCAILASFYGGFLDLPFLTRTEQGGYDFIRTDGTRIYESIDAMLKLEKLDILYPAELPDGYKFTNFEAANFDNYLEVRMYSKEPYIYFTIRVGTNYEFVNYDYELNGIKYNILETEENLYQAAWIDSEDYYMVAISDEAVLSEIIKNLQRS